MKNLIDRQAEQGHKIMSPALAKRIKVKVPWGERLEKLPHYSAEGMLKLTTPGQSKSIKELHDRYEKGRPNAIL